MSLARHKENLFPITWTGWDELDVLALQFYDVEFTEDFGKAKKGDKFDSLFVDFGEGKIEAYEAPAEEDEDGFTPCKVAFSMKFKAVPLDKSDEE